MLCYKHWLQKQPTHSDSITIETKQTVNGVKAVPSCAQDEHVLKRSLFTIATELLNSHLSYIINYKQHLGCFIQLYNRYDSTCSNFPITLWPWILIWWDKTSMRFITSTSLNSIPNSIQINWKVCEIMGVEVFAFSHSCDLESSSRSIRPVLKYRVQ